MSILLGCIKDQVLFILYINEIEAVLKEAKSGSFADDTRLMKSIDSQLDTCLMQLDLNAIVTWSLENNMLLHENKFELLCYLFNRPHLKLMRELPFAGDCYEYSTPGGFPLQPEDVVKDLGVLLSANCSWSAHIGKIVKDARKMASWVLGVFRDRSARPMLHLYKTMVRCRLEYCSPVWNPSSIGDIQMLEGVQRHFTNRIAGCYSMSYYERLKHLRLQSLQRRRERYCIIHVWKMYHSIAPNDIAMDFVDHPRHGVRVRLPPINRHATAAAKSLYDCSFAIRAAKLWNILPKEVNNVPKLDGFKERLGRLLEGFPDTPPTTGYAPANSNSLLDWASGAGGAQMLRP